MPEDQSEPILLERDGSIVTLTLNAPPRNPISMAMVDSLEVLLPKLAADKSVRAIVITGAGTDSFSVGANIKEFASGVAKMTLKGLIDQRLRVLDAVENLGKPVVAAIRGTCLGGGLELALSCHFRIAGKEAVFALPEIELGIVPAWSGTQRLTCTVGRAHALDMMLRARKVGAEEAWRMGLVHEVCADNLTLPNAQALARELAEKPPLAVAGILRAVIEGQELPLNEGLKLEFEAVQHTSGTKDNMEGLAAFLQKRKPRFTGE